MNGQRKKEKKKEWLSGAYGAPGVKADPPTAHPRAHLEGQLPQVNSHSGQKITILLWAVRIPITEADLLMYRYRIRSKTLTSHTHKTHIHQTTVHYSVCGEAKELRDQCSLIVQLRQTGVCISTHMYLFFANVKHVPTPVSL